MSNNLQKILDVYAPALGQCKNNEKTTMVFSRNVSDKDKADISALWGCRVTKQYEKYLDLPPMIGRSKKKAFSKIKTKVW